MNSVTEAQFWFEMFKDKEYIEAADFVEVLFPSIFKDPKDSGILTGKYFL